MPFDIYHENIRFFAFVIRGIKLITARKLLLLLKNVTKLLFISHFRALTPTTKNH